MRRTAIGCPVFPFVLGHPFQGRCLVNKGSTRSNKRYHSFLGCLGLLEPDGLPALIARSGCNRKHGPHVGSTPPLMQPQMEHAHLEFASSLAPLPNLREPHEFCVHGALQVVNRVAMKADRHHACAPLLTYMPGCPPGLPLGEYLRDKMTEGFRMVTSEH